MPFDFNPDFSEEENEKKPKIETEARARSGEGPSRSPQLGTAQPGFLQWPPSERLPSPGDTSSLIEGPTLSPGRCHPEILNLMTSAKTLWLNKNTFAAAGAHTFGGGGR